MTNDPAQPPPVSPNSLPPQARTGCGIWVFIIVILFIIALVWWFFATIGGHHGPAGSGPMVPPAQSVPGNIRPPNVTPAPTTAPPVPNNLNATQPVR